MVNDPNCQVDQAQHLKCRPDGGRPNPTCVLLPRLPPFVGFKNVLHGRFSWLHQTVSAIGAHRGCRPQPSRANGGIPSISQQPIRVSPRMGSRRPWSWVPGMGAPRHMAASGQSLSTPQGAEAPQVKRQLSLLAHAQYSWNVRCRMLYVRYRRNNFASYASKFRAAGLSRRRSPGRFSSAETGFVDG